MLRFGLALLTAGLTALPGPSGALPAGVDYHLIPELQNRTLQSIHQNHVHRRVRLSEACTKKQFDQLVAEKPRLPALDLQAERHRIRQELQRVRKKAIAWITWVHLPLAPLRAPQGPSAPASFA